MERINRALVVFVGLIGMTGLGAVEPATQPAAQPAVAAPTAPVNNDMQQNRRDRRNRGNRGNPAQLVAASDPYAILRTRSIFVKGNQMLAGDPTPSRNPFGPLSGRSEAALVFNGVIMTGEDANALIEDTGSGEVNLVRVGDAIAKGRVSAITFDDLTYEVNGQTNHVSLGQNLTGVTPTSVTTAALAPTSQPTDGSGGGAPAAGPSAATPSGLSADEILARMAAKRKQELGIK